MTLLGPKYLGTSTLLAGGVALYATNEFLTISLLPSAIADIGGQRLYAWVTTVYLVGVGGRGDDGQRGAAAARAAVRRICWDWPCSGSAAWCARSAPTMEVLLVGRTVQGAAGGLLAGLGYAVINSALPRSLWTRASALVSAMWGVGTVVGPAAGGLFAQFGLWRWAFGVAGDPDRGDGRAGSDRATGARVDRRARAARWNGPGVVAAAAGRGGADRSASPRIPHQRRR